MMKSYLRKTGTVLSRALGIDRSLDLLGGLAAESVRRRDSLGALSDAEFRVHSQWGEDGILEWLIQRLPVPSERFVEFGVESYTESNTRFLLKHRDWRGMVIDSSPQNVRAIKKDPICWRHDLTVICSFVTKENINELLSRSGFVGDIGVLSVDIDGNDYWIWDAIDVVNPRIVVCEYNAVFGDIRSLTIPYDPTFQRTKAHYSNLYFGCSINALCDIAERKGYTLLGTNLAGCNAFFVRNDIVARVRPAVSDTYPRSSRARESRDLRGRLTYVGGLQRLVEIGELPVLDLETNTVVLLRDVAPVYSDRWLSQTDKEPRLTK